MARKNYQSIVKPLKKIKDQLIAYAEDRKKVSIDLENQKLSIDVTISESNQEEKMASFTAGKIGALLGADGFEEDSQDTPTPKAD